MTNICVSQAIKTYYSSLDISVGTVTGYGLDGRGFDSRQEQETLLHCVQTGSWAHPASYPVDTLGNFASDKRSEREADHSSPTSAEIKNGGAISPRQHRFLWHDA
jgi:hypothetical protein